MKKLIGIIVLSLPLFAIGQGALGEVIGTLVSKENKTPLVGAKVQTKSNGTVYGAKTDLDGRFRISAIPSGKYYFSISYNGDTLSNILADVSPDGIENIGEIVFEAKILELGPANAEYDSKRLRLKYGVTPEIKMDHDQIKRSPVKFDQSQMIASMSSEIKMADDGQLMFRGARKGDMIYMMDGIKMTAVMNVPSASIGSMSVFTGGIPAKYGDTNGGVVVMESLSYFDLYRAWYAQQLKNE